MDFYVIFVLGCTSSFLIMISIFWVSVVIAKKLDLVDSDFCSLRKNFKVNGGENEFVTQDNEIL